ncbi:hypothetical protein B484DRAFT_396756 [Ochromonadaceae sp. CCMP2298]|nr:hypothetical protein B484DRAFT_396756 [Ochromonadaceae sp. CCMP2298]
MAFLKAFVVLCMLAAADGFATSLRPAFIDSQKALYPNLAELYTTLGNLHEHQELAGTENAWLQLVGAMNIGSCLCSLAS